MSYLFPHLSFQDPEGGSTSPRVALPPRGTTILLSDTLASPAGFVLMHFVASQLKAGKQIVLVGVGEGLGHYRAVAKKMHLDDSPLTFIDALTNLSSPSATSAAAVVPNVAPSLASSSSEAAPLRPLYDLINSTLKGKGKATNTSLSDNLPGPTETLVIIDDLSALEWMGVDLDDVSKFVRALQARCRSTSSSLVLLTHGSTTSSPSLPSDTLFRTLYPSVDLLIQCRGLSSGRSGEVSGELSFTPTPLLLTADPAFPATSPGKELQYKLGDSTVTFFAKGTGYGFL